MHGLRWRDVDFMLILRIIKRHEDFRIVLDPLVEIMFHATKKNYTKTLEKFKHELRIF